jgi:hypothetical protein
MSSNKSILLKSFNKQFFDFIDDIISIMPDNRELQKSKVYFTTVKQANPSILVKIWYQNILGPYKSVIESGDIQFFLDKDYTQDLKDIPHATEVIKVIDTSIRNPIKEMDQQNKKQCVKYIQLLSKISEAYSQ